MVTNKLMLVLAVLVLTTLACNVNINLPNINTYDTGPTVEEQIIVPVPDIQSPEVEIIFGAGELIILPGPTANLIEGTATYNIEEFKPKVNTEGRVIRLQQGEGRIEGFPTFSDRMIMEWSLILGDTPMALTISTGAAESSFDLGGISLTNLAINQGASDSTIDFSEPNLTEMDEMRVNAGAGNLNLLNLANANVESKLRFVGGAGNYTLDFAGDLRQDLFVEIEAGVGNVIVVVPSVAPVEVVVKGALANVNPLGNWDKDDNTYSQTGEGNKIFIEVNMVAGNLTLQN